MGLILRNRVFYNKALPPEPTYRQLTVIQESDNFELRLYEGDVMRTGPDFHSPVTDAEVHLHPTLTAALDDLERESKRAEDDGFLPYGLC